MRKSKLSISSKFLHNYGKPPVRLLYSISRKIVSLFFRKIYHTQWEMDPKIHHLTGPIILLANHPSNFDPFILACAVDPLRVNFLAASTYFRNKFFRYLLYHFGAIPKTQFRADAAAVKATLKVIRRNGVLGIFPEGSRSIDGTSLTIEDSITKLIKKTEANVVVAISNGAYLTWPRWSSNGTRKGKIDLKIRLLLAGNEVADYSLNKLSTCIIDALQFDDYEWQKEHRVPYRSSKPAEGLHNVLHKCPACKKDWITQSIGHRLECRSCKNAASMDSYGFMSPESDTSVIFETVRDWNRWQKNEFMNTYDPDHIEISDEARLMISYRSSSFKHAGKGTLTLTKDHILFEGTHTFKKVRISFPLSGILGISSQYGKYFDIIDDEYTYKFLPKTGQKVISFSHAIEFIRKSYEKEEAN
jgi:1-acyl-sn-glycerol-3-phosphate acyltransferase